MHTGHSISNNIGPIVTLGDNCSVFENVMAQIHHRIEIQCKMKLKYHRDRILTLLIFLTLIGVSSHQPLYFFVPISPQGF